MTKLKKLFNKGISIAKEEGLLSFLSRLYRFIKRIGKRIIFGRVIEKKTTAASIYSSRFPHLQPLNYIKVERDDIRINVVTDSLEKKSLFGGVATALIMATLYADKNNITLRIITRETKNNPEDYEYFLKIQGLSKPIKVEYFSDYDRNKPGNTFKLETSEKDIYLTTSWWSTYVTRDIITRGKIFYLLQEVETFFYPYGDEHYLCGEIIKDKDISFIINSSYLYDFYKNNGYENIINNSIYFEPAFSEKLYKPENNLIKTGNKYNLFFYARPNNPRNLFYYGLKLLNEAIKADLIKKEEWNIYFAGSLLPKIELAKGMEAIILGQMSWEEYLAFIKKVDLGFCLMYTPHPSYPPLDIASSGGVVLTNKFMNKQSLDSYSTNIICEDLDTKNMMNGFKKAIDLVKSNKQRLKNFENNKIEKNWEKTLKPVLEYMDKGIKES